jgi:hypothetical protein
MPITASGLPVAPIPAAEKGLLLPEKWFPPPHVCMDIYTMIAKTRKIKLKTVPPRRLEQNTLDVVIGFNLLHKEVGMIRPAEFRFSELEFLWNTRIYEQLLICGLLILCPERLEKKGTAKQEKK